jgi:hypothetical protein
MLTVAPSPPALWDAGKLCLGKNLPLPCFSLIIRVAGGVQCVHRSWLRCVQGVYVAGVCTACACVTGACVAQAPVLRLTWAFVETVLIRQWRLR